MRIDILTLFPDLCDGFMRESIIGRARKNHLLEIHCHDIRDYTPDKHRRVDDYPYGGGKGMVMQAEPIFRCYEALCRETGAMPHLVYMSPQGKTLTQQRVRELAGLPNLVLLCGHYEGVDERVLETIVDEEISIGDYVLTGGELAALVVTDSVARMLPGVLADEVCFTDESHYAGLLEYPQYTRPAVWREQPVPQVLLNGDHGKIAQWRAETALERTRQKRPDLLQPDVQKESR
jgi:tRNA (guanine37-N1)-methyltransferase